MYGPLSEVWNKKVLDLINVQSLEVLTSGKGTGKVVADWALKDFHPNKYTQVQDSIEGGNTMWSQ